MSAALQKPTQEEAKKPLKPIERELLLLVLKGFNPTAAMRKVAPDSKRPDVMASRILARAHVQAERIRLDENALDTVGVTRVMIADELRKLAFSNKARLMDANGNFKAIHELDPDDQACISEVEIEQGTEEKGQPMQLSLVDGLVQLKPKPRVRKIKLWDKPKALLDLAAMRGMKNDDVQGERVGPGLTVIIQQGVQVSGGTQPAAGPGIQAAQRVVVNLPPPGGE